MPAAALEAWAQMLIRNRINRLERLRRKACKQWERGRHVHRLRTHARRLRAALEDLSDCVPRAQALIDESKLLGQKTGKVRDADVLAHKLQRYRRTAFSAEGSEIDAVCAPLRKQRKAAHKPAKAAVRDAHLKMPS